MYGNLKWQLIFASAILSCASCYLKFEPNVVEPLITECEIVKLWTDPPLRNNITIELEAEYSCIVHVSPENITVESNSSWPVEVCAKHPGLTTVLAKISGSNSLYEILNGRNEAVLHVIVGKIRILKVIALVVGWIYFTACTISFYPQMYENYSRKSVVGLNFDYCVLNIAGFLSYTFYNIGMLFIPWVQKEYFIRHPTGLNPVEYNDLCFSAHGFLASVATMYQCFIYERLDQCVSRVTKMILLFYVFLVVTSGITAYFDIIHWLDFLYYCSYIKLSVTFIKYVPQAVMNYTRKSTVGWCIYNVMLDFIGATFSVSQMLINGYNYNDWESIFGDPTKFGLGSVSIFFDILFFCQHYILYRSVDEKRRKDHKDYPFYEEF